MRKCVPDRLTDCGAVGVTFVKWERKHIKTVPLRSLRKLEEELVMGEFRKIKTTGTYSVCIPLSCYGRIKKNTRGVFIFSL